MNILFYETEDQKFIIIQLRDFDIVFFVDDDWYVGKVKNFPKAGTNQYETKPFSGFEDKPDHLVQVLLQEVIERAGN